MARWIIARDSEGYHVRETIFVHHNAIKGEVSYDTKPRGSAKSLREALRLARKIEKKR